MIGAQVNGEGLPSMGHPKDPAWICAWGPFPEAHDDRCWGLIALRDLVKLERGPLKKEVLVADPWSWWTLNLELLRRKPSKLTKAMQIVLGMKLSPQKTLLPSSPFLAYPYFLGALQAWGISMGMMLRMTWNR